MPKPSPKKPDDIEFAPDAWERFERLVKAGAKIGHMPHDGSPPHPKKAVKKKAAKKR
jgi:hypothetical protein